MRAEDLDGIEQWKALIAEHGIVAVDLNLK
jgi:hypothetical protein